YRGVDFAAYSGYLAAKAFKKAHEEGDYSEKTLSYYDNLLRDSFILRSLRKFRGVHELMLNPRLFKVYPELINSTLKAMFNIREESKKFSEAFNESKRGKIGLLTLLLDLFKIYRRL
ncbi:hypothetical protein DRN87_06290, partial [Candidatus Geothermarchaeota archaeon]